MNRAARLAAAAVCAALAGWLSFSYTARAERRAGPVRPVLAVTRALPAGAGEDAIAGAVTVRNVPQAYLPADALGDVADVAGASVLTALPRGAFVTRSALAGSRSATRFRLRTGERAVTVDAVTAPAGSDPAAGARIDLYASGFGGDQRTVEVIAGAEVLEAEQGAAGRARLTLRLAAAQVAGVVRADVFAHELRAVARPRR